MPLDVLAFGAHPDDVEISCGATLHKLASLGRRVGICDLTRGEASTRGTVQIRAGEAEAARRLLGAEARVNLGLPDTALSRADRAQLTAVVETLRAHRPRLVIAPYWIDQHPDHEEASALVTRAAFVAGLKNFANAGGDRFRPVTLLYTMFRRPFEAALVVDVTGSLEAKLDSVRAHRSQTHAEAGDADATRLTRPDFLAALEARARFYGGRIGVLHGEAFCAREELAVDDPVQAFVGERADRILG